MRLSYFVFVGLIGLTGCTPLVVPIDSEPRVEVVPPVTIPTPPDRPQVIPEPSPAPSTPVVHPPAPQVEIVAPVVVPPAETVPAPSVEAEPAKANVSVMEWLKPAIWQDLPGWKDDDLALAWPAFVQSCKALRRKSGWQAVCAAAEKLASPDASTVRGFVEKQFNLYQIAQADGALEGLVTGYYEPLLRGSREFNWKYRFPLYAPPDDLLIVDLSSVYPELKNLRLRGRLQGKKIVPYFNRGEIESGKAPMRGKEVAWVDDPVELFFLQVQGSGRIQLDNGEVMRIGYADQNGHPYKSIGKWLVEQGELTLDKASMQGIKDWGRRNPAKLSDLLATNPSYVFFRELPNAQGGPLGSLGVPLTPERSIAVDPRAIPLGAPVWLASTQPNSSDSLNRLVIAQDTGGAIRGNVRADFFWGFGDEAGQKAGAMKQKGRMWLMLPLDYPVASSQSPAAKNTIAFGLGGGRKNGIQ